MQRVFETWPWPAWRPSPKLTRQLLETALVLLLALQTVRLVWLLSTPTGPIGAAAPLTRTPARAVDLTVLERFDPFFRNQPGVGVAASPAPAEGGLSLFGVRSDGKGGGSAILGSADGVQTLYNLGEDVEGGLVLRVVAADHVVLARGGSRLRLEFSDAPSSGSAPAASGAVLAPASLNSVAAPGGLDPSQFLSAAALSPTMKDGQITGYRVMARGRGEALAQAGLQDGDVLIAVDGSSLNPERVSELPDLLSKAQDVEVRFERNGQIMTTRLGAVPR